MHRLIWLVPLLPLLGAAINGLFGRKFKFSERVIGRVAIGSVGLSFLISVLAVYSYGFGPNALWPNPYLTSDDGAFSFIWISGGAVEITEGARERARIQIGDKARELMEAGETGPRLIGVAQEPRQSGRGALLDIEWSYQLDPLSAIFMLFVTGVGLCIFLFATGYMHGDAGFYRFFAYMGLFMFSMLVLVMGSNFVVTFVGWEGVGLCSYLLIGYYFDRKEAGDASRKAFITNRIGDFGFLLAIAAIIATFGTTQFRAVAEQAAAYPIELIGTWGIMSWIALGLFVGACGKSAQVPLHVWLPDAMAGPTPVSALIHAATMVTAGVYIVARTNVIFQHSQTMMMVVAIVGAFTAIFAASIAVTQTDIKKVLAYSTVSQLGFMFLACGVGAFVIGIFHVVTHAFFKALLFLGAGSVIHGMHHEQDLRRMGGLKKYMPYTYYAFLAGWLAICGIIPFSGFWSKDEILWGAASTDIIPGGWALWLVAIVAATFTAFYMTRLVALAFWGKERFLEVPAGGQADEAHAHGYDVGIEPHPAMDESVADRPRHEPGEYVGVFGAPHAHVPKESPPSMWAPLVILAVLSFAGGFIGISPAFTGGEHIGGRLNIVNWLQPVVWNASTGRFGSEHAASPEQSIKTILVAATAPVAPAEESSRQKPNPYLVTGFNLAHAIEERLGSHTAAEWFFIGASLVVAIFGILLGLLFYLKGPELSDAWAKRLGPVYRASFNKYWVDELYAALFTRRTMDTSRAVYAVDSKVVDGAVNGSAWLTRKWSLVTGGFDRIVIDGIVNGIAAFVRALMSPLIRAVQTGLAQNYALFMVLGLVVIVLLYFSSDVLNLVRSR